MVHYSMGAWELAAKDAASAVACKPDFVKGFIRLAAATKELNEFSEALGAIDQGLKLSEGENDLVKLQAKVRFSFTTEASKVHPNSDPSH